MSSTLSFHLNTSSLHLGFGFLTRIMTNTVCSYINPSRNTKACCYKELSILASVKSSILNLLRLIVPLLIYFSVSLIGIAFTRYAISGSYESFGLTSGMNIYTSCDWLISKYNACTYDLSADTTKHLWLDRKCMTIHVKCIKCDHRCSLLMRF